ncbi:MAG: hypothetical protein ACK5H2_04840 [Beutenbergiaceae bacterium]
MRAKVLGAALLAAATILGGCAPDPAPEPTPDPTPSAQTTPAPDPAADKEAIEAVAAEYFAATVSAAPDGAPLYQIYALFSPDTVAYFDEVASLAHTAGPAEIAELEISQRTVIITMRALLTYEQLAQTDGAFAFGAAQTITMLDVGLGMVPVTGDSVTSVSLDGDLGYAEIVFESEPTGDDMQFVRVGSEWTIDCLEELAMPNEVVPMVVADGEMTEDEAILRGVSVAISQLGIGAVDESIFEVPQP